MRELYDSIFKRKSFHLFRDTGVITPGEISGLTAFIKIAKPLDPEISISVQIVPESKTTCQRGAQYCVLFYSEARDGYLQNIGYLGEQIDLYLAANNIGALWLGIGKPEQQQWGGLDFVIMMAIAKMPEDKFRRDMFRAKRKPLREIWFGEPLAIADIVRFAPSACNTQPWIIENTGGTLSVYRYRKPGRRGIMPAGKVVYYNRIDMGILLCFLEICLCRSGVWFKRTLCQDDGGNDEKTLAAVYHIP